jgi:hypothetical protein
MLAGCSGDTLDVGAIATPARTDAEVAVEPVAATREQAEALCQKYDEAERAYFRNCTAQAFAGVPAAEIRACIDALSSRGITATGIASLTDCVTRTSAECGIVDTCFRDGEGVLPVGASCFFGLQCATGWCRGGNRTFLELQACGLCAQALQPHDTCTVGSDACVEGYSCQASCDSTDCDLGHCELVAPEPPATFADLGDPCSADTVCRGPNECVDGMCVPLQRADQDCSARACISPLICDALTKKCRQPVMFGPGQDCRAADGTTGMCEGLFPWCPILDDGTQRCVVWRKEGDPCDGEGFSPQGLMRCEFPLACRSHRCVYEWPTCTSN